MPSAGERSVHSARSTCCRAEETPSARALFNTSTSDGATAFVVRKQLRSSDMTTTVTGLFETRDDAANAVAEIKAAGVSKDEISIITNKAACASSSPGKR